MTDIPIVITTAGAQPRSPNAIRDALLALVSAQRPGYSADLPGSLIEDISSTDVAAIAMADAAWVELLNSLTPYGANAFLLNQLGQVYGVTLGLATNTSVFVIFTGPPGFVVAKGFTVSDGTYQYILQDGGIIGSGGESEQLFALASIPGTWSIPAGTVVELITSVPEGIDLSVVNPVPGTPGGAAETEQSYRARVLQAGLSNTLGAPTTVKTALGRVTGVQTRLISFRQNENDKWEVLCGGGDPYQVAYAVFRSMADINDLEGSTLRIQDFTNANPGVATTDLNHLFTTGQEIDVLGSDPGTFDGHYTITVIDEKSFSVGVNTTGFGSYVDGGVVTPNLRNIVTSINDYPDTYVIPYVNPPKQDVDIVVTWNTNSPNFVSPAAIAQLGGPALVDYVNSLAAGVPINQFELDTALQQAVASILDPQLLTRIVMAVSINGVSTPPISGTGIIRGDPESYFLTDTSRITFIQG